MFLVLGSAWLSMSAHPAAVPHGHNSQEEAELLPVAQQLRPVSLLKGDLPEQWAKTSALLHGHHRLTLTEQYGCVSPACHRQDLTHPSVSAL